MANAKKRTQTPAKKSAKKKAAPKKAAPKKAARVAAPPRRTLVRRSPIHGRGVFATVDIPKGERVIEYKARKITWAQADRWYADDDSKPSHTFLFTLDDKYVLDGNKDANSARWINHSCNPNCESDIVAKETGEEKANRIRIATQQKPTATSTSDKPPNKPRPLRPPPLMAKPMPTTKPHPPTIYTTPTQRTTTKPRPKGP